MKICHHGAKIFNKTYSFEVSIGLLPLILIVSSKVLLYRSLMTIHCQQGTEIFNKTCSFEVSIGLLPLISIVSVKRNTYIQKFCDNLSSWSQDI